MVIVSVKIFIETTYSPVVSQFGTANALAVSANAKGKTKSDITIVFPIFFSSVRDNSR